MGTPNPSHGPQWGPPTHPTAANGDPQPHGCQWGPQSHPVTPRAQNGDPTHDTRITMGTPNSMAAHGDTQLHGCQWGPPTQPMTSNGDPQPIPWLLMGTPKSMTPYGDPQPIPWPPMGTPNSMTPNEDPQPIPWLLMGTPTPGPHMGTPKPSSDPKRTKWGPHTRHTDNNGDTQLYGRQWGPPDP